MSSSLSHSLTKRYLYLLSVLVKISEERSPLAWLAMGKNSQRSFKNSSKPSGLISIVNRLRTGMSSLSYANAGQARPLQLLAL